jgi:hypothetical protein
MSEENMEQGNTKAIVICPICKSENPEISICLTCGAQLKREKSNAKDLIPRPVWLTVLAGLYALLFIKNMFLILFQKNAAAIAALIIIAIIEISMAYGLWQLKKWAWTVVVISCFAGIILVWLIPILLWLNPSEGLRLFYKSFFPVAVRNQNLNDFFMAAAIKGSLIRAILRSIINVLILAYFYSPRIREIFSDNPVFWKAASL